MGPAEPAGCMTKCFCADENGLVAAAVALDVPWAKRHDLKAKVAHTLFLERKLKPRQLDGSL